MKHIKTINEFWNPFRKRKNLSFDEVQEKCVEMVDIIYPLFDEYDIIDGNEDYYSEDNRNKSEPAYDHWRYAVYSLDLSNPKDRIIISADMEKTDNIYSKLEQMKKSIEKQIDCKIELFYNLKKKSDIFDNLGRHRGEKGRIVVTIKHNLKLKSSNIFASVGGDIGPG